MGKEHGIHTLSALVWVRMMHGCRWCMDGSSRSNTRSCGFGRLAHIAAMNRTSSSLDGFAHMAFIKLPISLARCIFPLASVVRWYAVWSAIREAPPISIIGCTSNVCKINCCFCFRQSPRDVRTSIQCSLHQICSSSIYNFASVACCIIIIRKLGCFYKHPIYVHAFGCDIDLDIDLDDRLKMKIMNAADFSPRKKSVSSTVWRSDDPPPPTNVFVCSMLIILNTENYAVDDTQMANGDQPARLLLNVFVCVCG